ncbi:hypothetical protein [Streptomyces sp. NPDC127112]|uniref:hypothetical protein n=1 Tax=Streptomyces sp. NPDC127112 TaxID=3345364 RepID=UPI00362FE1E2
MGDRLRTRMDRDIGHVASLLRQAHSALGLAMEVLSTSAGSDSERTMADLGRTLRELRGEADDLASAAFGALPQEMDRQSVLMALHVAEDIGRIGVLIEQVGEIAQARRSGPSLTQGVLLPVRDLGGACLRLMARACDVLRSDAPPAVMDGDLADIVARQRGLNRLLLSGGDEACPMRDAADAVVLGRCYEECAFRAAAVARIAVLLREHAPRR